MALTAISSPASAKGHLHLLSARSPHSGSLHPSPVLSQAQYRLRKTPARQERVWQLLTTARPQLDTHPPCHRARRQGGRALGQCPGQGHKGAKLLPGAGLRGGRILRSSWSVWAQERNEGMALLGLGWGKCQFTFCRMPVPGHSPPEDRALFQRRPDLPRALFPRGRLKPPQFEADFL